MMTLRPGFRSLVWMLLLALTLTACGGSAAPTPLPTVVLGTPGAANATAAPSAAGGVMASGVVAPAAQAQIAAAAAANVAEVLAAEGDTVAAGQVLVRLGGSEQAAVAAAAAEVERLAAAQALTDLQNQAAVRRAAAMQTVAEANRAVRDAQYKVDTYLIPTTLVEQDPVKAVATTRAALDTARAAFEPYKLRSQSDSTRKALLERLTQAQSDYDAAIRRLENGVTLAQAQAELEKANQDYAAVADGPDPAQVAAAQARLAAAEAQIAAAQAALANLELKAPFAGTLTAVNVQPGEWVVPGETLLGLADLAHLQIETTDLSERDVPQVTVGQAVEVTIKALGVTVAGRVSQIAPLANTLGGDVVYPTTITLDETPPELRAGMSVDVRFSIIV